MYNTTVLLLSTIYPREICGAEMCPGPADQLTHETFILSSSSSERNCSNWAIAGQQQVREHRPPCFSSPQPWVEPGIDSVVVGSRRRLRPFLGLNSRGEQGGNDEGEGHHLHHDGRGSAARLIRRCEAKGYEDLIKSDII